MPGCFPGDPSMQIVTTRGPLPQGKKRKRDPGSSDKEDAPTAPLPVVRVKPIVPDNSPKTDDEHVVAPRAPLLSLRAREATNTNEPLKDYEQIRKLGESSEGKVYLAKSKKTAEVLAIKILKLKKN